MGHHLSRLFTSHSLPARLFALQASVSFQLWPIQAHSPKEMTLHERRKIKIDINSTLRFQDETVITMMVEVSDSIFRARGCQKLSETIALDLNIVFCAAFFLFFPICHCVCTVYLLSVPSDHSAFFRKMVNSLNHQYTSGCKRIIPHTESEFAHQQPRPKRCLCSFWDPSDGEET